MQYKPFQQLAVSPGGQQLIEWTRQLCPLGVHYHIHIGAGRGAVGRRIQAAVAVKDLIIGWQDCSQQDVDGRFAVAVHRIYLYHVSVMLHLVDH